MKEAWRRFGPHDPVALDHVRQAGATEIVSALHQLKPGEAWTDAAVAERIHFVHLRATKRDASEPLSFIEADHLDGDVDMVGVISALVREDRKRASHAKIPFRPDHGHRMFDDVKKTVTPGYAGIGRLKGLGELRGVMRAVERLS